MIFGVHPPSVDAACAYLMGFDPDKIPIVARAFLCRGFPLSDHSWSETVIRSNRCGLESAAHRNRRRTIPSTSSPTSAGRAMLKKILPSASAETMVETVPRP